ncbi:hypothetical protein N0B44_22930 [Roseibacterium beibuensis]|uniref:Pilus assembly protein n=1 Tax=[Roseibacterium] beibuensis TaxID=1193142 RepID=A0ABP9LMQ8_9RHOB|nr:hypothetical protein [Roseibacterium beibuensis]MCS6625772.1 hypothetical protein [Roseibacterium beibuensis]
MRVARFIWRQDGVVTVDWVVLLGALTVAGLLVLSMMTGSLGDHSTTVASELQDPHFNTTWTLPVEPD